MTGLMARSLLSHELGDGGFVSKRSGNVDGWLENIGRNVGITMKGNNRQFMNSGAVKFWGLLWLSAWTLWADDSPSPLARVIFPTDVSVLDAKRNLGAMGDGVANDTVLCKKASMPAAGLVGRIESCFCRTAFTS